MVRDLVNVAAAQWDRELIRELFTEESAAGILRLPIPHSDQVDRWIWAWEQTGEFSVMSFL